MWWEQSSIHPSSLLQILLPAYCGKKTWKTFRYPTEAVILYLRWVFVCMCLLTFSAHAHRPMLKNAAPSNCKTKHTQEEDLLDRGTW